MKKSKIAVAVFTVVIVAASFARAEGFGVDFDKGSFRTADFMEAVKASKVSKTDNAASITPVPVTAVNKVNRVYELSAPGLQKLRKEVITMPGLSEEFLQQINKENTVVLYNEDSVFLTTLVGAIQHIILESNDKKLMEFISKQKAGALQANLQQKMTCWNVIKILWKVVNGISIAYEVATQICNTPSTPGSGGIAPIPGGSSVPGVHHERMGGL